MDALIYFFVNYFSTDNLNSIKTNSPKAKKSQRWESLTTFSQGLVSFSHTMTQNSQSMTAFSQSMKEYSQNNIFVIDICLFQQYILSFNLNHITNAVHKYSLIDTI